MVHALQVCYLRADYSMLACIRGPNDDLCVPTADYASLLGSAKLVLLLYIVLVPAIFWRLLLKASSAICAEKRTLLSGALKFLHGPYRPMYYYFELVEMCRMVILSAEITRLFTELMCI